MTSLPIVIRTLRSQHCLIIRARLPDSMVAATIRDSIDRTRIYAARNGGTLVDAPFTRYPMTSGKLVTFETGWQLESPIAGNAEVEASMLRGGRVAVAVHGESPAQLPLTYAVLKNWLAGRGEVPGGAPWESYVGDPVQETDPASWRTEIFQPLR